MEYKILILFGVLTATQAFDYSSVRRAPTYQQLQKDTTSTTEESNTACYNSNGEGGECVQSSLCDPATSTVIEDGTGVINFRSQRRASCVAPLVCCKSGTNKTPERNDSPLTMAMRQQRDVPRQGCGWRNENGTIKVNGRIPDGYAYPGELPWTVSIHRAERVVDKMIKYYYVGGGFLIHEKVVLTAAHVLPTEQYYAALYVNVGNYDGDRSILQHKMKYVQTVVVHEQYQKETFVNDIAMLIMWDKVKWLPHIGAICLPPLNEPVVPGTKCFGSGWGNDATDTHLFVMGKVEMPVLSADDCQTSLRTTDVGPFFELNQCFMCAGGVLGVDTCRGSGGSPLACPIAGQPGRYMATGLLSWGMSCGLDGQPSVYIDVARSRQWIDDKMKLHGLSIASYSDY